MTPTVTKREVVVDDQTIEVISLQNEGISMICTSYGGTILSLKAPNRDGIAEEVTLCYRSAAELIAQKGGPYYGCITGRVANRICKGIFELDGKRYQLAVNNGVNHLHGGVVGFNQRLWQTETVSTPSTEEVGVLFRYVSVDGEEGYPGNLQVTVGYFLTKHNELRITYEASTDKATIVNLTNHTYWNLSGDCRERIYDHRLQLCCSHYLPVDATQIPTGERRSVINDVHFDFRGDVQLLREAVLNVDGCGKSGLDHSFICDDQSETVTVSSGPLQQVIMRRIAVLSHASSGRVMTVFTSQPAVQVYSGNWLDGEPPHVMHNAICLETQDFPDAIHHTLFPSVILRPDERYQHQSVFAFSVIP